MLHRSLRPAALAGLLAASLAFASCSNRQGQAAPMAPQALPLPVTEVPLKTVTGYTAYPTGLEGRISSEVRAKIPGYITAVLVDEGQRVSAGQVLFRLETQSLSQDAEAAQASVQAARVEVERLRPLVEKDIVSEVMLHTAEAKLAQAEATLNGINANIGYATIKSPVNGYIGAITYREGALVSPSDPQPLTTVSNVDEMYAYFAMNERDYLNFLQSTPGKSLEEKISQFPKVKLRLINDSIYREEGRIETVTGQVNPTTGSVQFRATFPNPDRLLADGNSGQVLIPTVYEGVPVVPESATFERQGRTYVYEVVGDTVAVMRSIDVRTRMNSLVVVGSGIDAGAIIATSGVGKLRDNTPVNPQYVAFDSLVNILRPVFK